jgi:hypothetical protein
MSSRDSAQMTGMADGAMAGMSHMDENMAHHMRMTALRTPTHADSMRALALIQQVRTAIAKYQDPAAAEAAGYREFLPNVKNQRVYHYTNRRNALKAQFTFDPAEPTSLLYQPQPDGSVRLIGAMFTAPKGSTEDQLDARVPLGIAQWHEHVNWCLPPAGQMRRMQEQRDGKPVFGPESPIATKAACEAVGGVFHPLLFNWMVHVNVFAGGDMGSVFRDEH